MSPAADSTNGAGNGRPLRSILIGRVSEEGDRAKRGRLATYEEQEKRALLTSGRYGAVPIGPMWREENVSGGTPLDQRMLGEAISMCENGEADAIIFGRRDRADRSIAEGSEAIRRMDAIGKLLLAGDEILTHATAADWDRTTDASKRQESFRRHAKEDSINGVVTRIEEDGVVPYRPGPGFIRNDNGSVRIDDQLAPIIREAWERRAAGETLRAAREFLAANGLPMSEGSLRKMFASPLYVGEVHKQVPDERGRKRVRKFTVVDAMVERHIWDAVQAAVVPSGRIAKSDRLLARLDWAHCGSCGARMVAGGQTWRYESRKTGEISSGRFPFYKCGGENGRRGTGTCPERATIAAEKLEDLVVEAAVAHYAGMKASADLGAQARAAEDMAEAARRQVKAAKKRLARLDPDEDDADAQEIIAELIGEQQAAEAEAVRLAKLSGRKSKRPAEEVLRSTDPELRAERRILIREAFPAGITILPGRAPVAERVVGL